PAGAADHVVAVLQSGNNGSYLITGCGAGRGVGADEAVGCRDDTRDPGRAAAPGRRAAIAVPDEAGDHVVAVLQSGDKVPHEVTGRGTDTGVGADETVGCRDDASDPSRAAAPGRRAAVAVPAGAGDHVVAVLQSGDSGPHEVTGAGTDEAIG